MDNINSEEVLVTEGAAGKGKWPLFGGQVQQGFGGQLISEMVAILVHLWNEGTLTVL